MKNRIILAIWIVSILFLLEIFRFVSLYHLDVLYWDQWGYYTPFFYDYNLWQGFFFQQGSHFLGLGYLTSLVVGKLSAFSIQAEGFLIGFLMFINVFLAASLKKKLTGTLQWFDVFLAPLILYVGYSEIYWGGQGAVAAFPLMSILIFGHIILIKPVQWRAGAICIIFFLSLFTGYAFITAGLIGVYTVYQLIFSKESRRSIFFALVFQLLTVALFLYEYRPPRASVCLLNDNGAPYLSYVTNLILNFFGAEVRKRDLVLILVGVAGPIFYGTWRSRFRDAKAGVLVVLLGFSLLYMTLNMMSRACMGAEAALAPRYSVFLIPGFLVFYILVVRITKDGGWKNTLPVILVILSTLFLRFEGLSQVYKNTAKHKKAVEAWTECYEEHQSWEVCTDNGMKAPFAPPQYDSIDQYLEAYRMLQKENE